MLRQAHHGRSNPGAGVRGGPAWKLPPLPGQPNIMLDLPSQCGRLQRWKGGASWVRRSSANNSGGAGGGATLASQNWLSRQRVLHAEPQPSDSDIINLNVGGTIMTTSRATLRQVPGSLLDLLFNPANSEMLVADAAGRVFLDHDPPAFALVLRFLRELRATGGCHSSVLLPAIPPADAAMFRSLAKRLGLRIADAAITSAELRGSAIAAAAAAAAAAASGGDADDRLSGSPYASRPASSSASSAGSPCALSPQQQQWWQQQLRRQQLVRPALTGMPPPGLGSSPAPGSIVSNTVGAAGGPSSCAAASPEAVARQRPASSPHPPGFSISSSGASGLSSSRPRSSSSSPSQQQQVRLPQPPPYVAVEPTVQHFYLQTSPAVTSAGGTAATAAAVAAAADASPLLPLRVMVQTEGDVLHQQQHRGSRGGQLAAAAAASDAAAACDIFCSVSSSPKQLLSFSFVARSSAGLDNLFVGVTSSNHADQRGLQIPAFGFRQVNILGTTPPPPHTASEHQPSPPGAAASSFDDALLHQFRRRLWQAGDLVQVLLELAGDQSNHLVLKVNGQPVPHCHELNDLPTFRHWAWYLCLFRGTEAVAVVFEADSVSVYSGDSRLKRFLG